MKRWIRSAIHVGPVPPVAQIDRFKKNMDDRKTEVIDVRRLIKELDSLRDENDFINPVVGIKQNGHVVTATFKNNKKLTLDADNLDLDWTKIVFRTVEKGF